MLTLVFCLLIVSQRFTMAESLGDRLAARLGVIADSPRVSTGTSDVSVGGSMPARQVSVSATASGPTVGLFLGNRRGIGINFCGGSVGSSGIRMCVAPCIPGGGGRCNTKAHTKKVSFPNELDPVEDGVFLLLPNCEVIRTDKWWRASFVGPVIDSHRQMTRSVEDWEVLLNMSSPSMEPERVRLFDERVTQTRVGLTPRAKPTRYHSVLSPELGVGNVWVDVSPSLVSGEDTPGA